MKHLRTACAVIAMLAMAAFAAEIFAPHPVCGGYDGAGATIAGLGMLWLMGCGFAWAVDTFLKAFVPEGKS